MIPGFDPVSADRRLRALVAAIQAFPEESRASVLREYLDAELGRLEAMEDAHQAFLGECVLLAIDNMQDARLQSVENRLAALESPDGPSVAEILTEAAIVFGLSLVSLQAAEFMGGAVLLWAGEEALAPAARKAVQEADEALLGTARTQVTTLTELQAKQALRADHLRGLTTVLDAMRGGSLSSALWQIGKALLSPIATAKSIGEALSKTFTVAAEIEAIQTQTLLSHLAMARGLETSVAARIEYENALIRDAARPDAQWRRLLDDATGNLILAPAYNVFEELWRKVPPPAQPVGDTVAEPFLASTPAGRLLTLMRQNRMAVREEYAVLRAGLAARLDEDFIDDPLVHTLTGVVNELTPLRAAYHALQDTVRPVIVRGYEAALWWAYLQTNGMLGNEEDVEFETDVGDLTAGDISDGYVVREAPPRVVHPEPVFLDPLPPQDTYVYGADYYPGIPLLGEERAEYLYQTFAKPYFDRPEHVRELPFKYDPAAYVGVRAQKKRVYGGLLTNFERARRIDEMRLMVILFFLQLPKLDDPTSSGMLTALGELRGTPPSAQGWLALHPEATAPVPPNPLADGSVARAAKAGAPAIAALLSDSGVLDRSFYDTQRAKLAAAINDLRNDIFEMQALATGVLMPEMTTRGIDVEDYDPIIKAKQKQLLDLYTQVLTSAQFDQAEVERVRADEALVDRLATWTLPPTETVQRTPWHFETPTPTP